MPVYDAGGVQGGEFVLAVYEDFPSVLEEEVALDDVEPEAHGDGPGDVLSSADDVGV